MTKDDSSEVNRVLEETKEYYSQRAVRYADWSHQTGEYEGGTAPDASWFADAQIVIGALNKSKLTGNVLEIASGTGIWTEALVKNVSSVTALDSSLEMIGRSKSRLKGNTKVRYIRADFYDWTPDAAYDAVTFAFWISHVPSSKLDESVSKVFRCLKPRGRVFFVDQRREAMSYEILDRPGGEIATRTLDDGRMFKIFKHFYSPDEIMKCFLRRASRPGSRIHPHISITSTVRRHSSCNDWFTSRIESEGVGQNRLGFQVNPERRHMTGTSRSLGR